MNADADLNIIKRRVYLTYFMDGLWDIALGLFLLAWGFTVWFDIPWLPGAIFILSFWLAFGLKQRITYPRVGYARPSETEKRTGKVLLAGTVILVAVVLGLQVLNISRFEFFKEYFEFLFGTSIVIAILIVAWWWRVLRWFLYAGMLFVFFISDQWAGLSFSLSFLIPGATVALCGLVILYRFIRTHKAVSEAELDAEG